MNKIKQLASVFEEQLSAKAAAKQKDKMSRKSILKRIDKSKATYQQERKKLENFKKQKEKLENELESCHNVMKDSRSEMLRLKNVLSNMDLADCNYAIMYENDCGYLIDGEEYHVKINDDGDLEVKPMKEHRKELKSSEKSDESEKNEADDSQEKEEELDNLDDLNFSNFRFID
jgi:hypothetical protein